VMSRSGIAFANSFRAFYVAGCLANDKGAT
jgi:hypothetical protein